MIILTLTPYHIKYHLSSSDSLTLQLNANFSIWWFTLDRSISSVAPAEQPLNIVLPTPGVWSNAESFLWSTRHMIRKKEQLGSLSGDNQPPQQQPFSGLGTSLFLVYFLVLHTLTRWCLGYARLIFNKMKQGESGKEYRLCIEYILRPNHSFL